VAGGTLVDAAKLGVVWHPMAVDSEVCGWWSLVPPPPSPLWHPMAVGCLFSSVVYVAMAVALSIGGCGWAYMVKPVSEMVAALAIDSRLG
jgi:hypothetical protein